MREVAGIECLRHAHGQTLCLGKLSEIPIDAAERLIIDSHAMSSARRFAATRAECGFEVPSAAAPDAHCSADTPRSGASM